MKLNLWQKRFHPNLNLKLNLKRPLLLLENLNPRLLNPNPYLKVKMKNLVQSIATSTAWGTSK